jgi:hypothetical protein
MSQQRKRVPAAVKRKKEQIRLFGLLETIKQGLFF